MKSDALTRDALPRRQAGLTLIELMVTIVISGFVIAGLNQVVVGALESGGFQESRADRLREASFALDRMARMVAQSRSLVLPQADKPATNWPEHIREQTVPPSPPIGSSVLATAVLSVLEPVEIDLDFDGFPDADNDRDGRVDEDLGFDMNWDGFAGVRGIDDGGDGFYDNVNWWDDDETGGVGEEDRENGEDDDGDGVVDEDVPPDMNGDGASGIAGVDDDADGQIDEGGSWDDDEDGAVDEDWLDTVTYFLSGTTLIERLPVPWDVTGNGSVTGWDYVESALADGVTRLRFERVVQSGTVLVDITIGVTDAEGDAIELNRRVRVGGAL